MISAASPAGLSASLQTQHQKNRDLIGESIERLTTGKRINQARDDPSGLIAAEKLRGELTDVRAEIKSFDSRELSLRGRESRLSSLQEGLNGLRGRAVEASGDLLGSDEKRALQIEVDETLRSFDRVAGGLRSSATDDLAFGGEANLWDGDTSLAQQIIEAESRDVSLQRAAVGAEQRGNDALERIARDKEVIVAESLSQIEDADFAEETSRLALSQTLTKAAAMAMVYSQRSHADTIGSLLDRIL